MSLQIELDQRPGLEQGDEKLTVTFEDGHRETMRLHEYGRVYAIPGLYEEVVQARLECASPATLAESLTREVVARGEEPQHLRALDLGAGNGVVAEELRDRGVTAQLVGLDSEPEAGPAARRDRPGLYAEYLTGTLEDVAVGPLVERQQLNCLIGAGALGLGHISTKDFASAWDAFPKGAWLAVTFPDSVLSRDGDDLSAYISALRRSEHGSEVTHLSRFRHRLRMNGQPIFYYVMVARRTH